MKTVLALILLTVTAALADEAPKHQVRAGRGITRQRGVVIVSVNVDLRGLEVGGSPAVLGAYVASVTFDTRRLELLEVRGAEDGAFASAPTSTDAEKANARGVVKLVAAQTNPEAPTGYVPVARLRFREKAAGGAETVQIHIDSVAAARHERDGTVSVVPLATE